MNIDMFVWLKGGGGGQSGDYTYKYKHIFFLFSDNIDIEKDEKYRDCLSETLMALQAGHCSDTLGFTCGFKNGKVHCCLIVVHQSVIDNKIACAFVSSMLSSLNKIINHYYYLTPTIFVFRAYTSFVQSAILPLNSMRPA